MIKRFLIVAAAMLSASLAYATSVQLNLTTSDPTQATGTWTLQATLSDTQDLGIASYYVDLDGLPLAPGDSTNTATALRAASAAATLTASNPPYALFRQTGTLSAPNVLAIGASQDTISALNNNDPSGLRFGDGVVGTAQSSTYGAIAGGGAMTIATGRWSTTGTGGFLQAVLSNGNSFNLFPNNYAVDDGTGQGNPPPAGTTGGTVAADSVISSNQIRVGPAVPEPTSLVLMGLAGVGLFVARRRSK